MDQLRNALDQVAFGPDVALNAIFLARHFSSYQDALQGSLAYHLHKISGGTQAEIPVSTDPVVQATREIARDIWPAMLMHSLTSSLGTFWTSTMVSASSHPGIASACRAFMADSELALLFPGTPSLEGAQDLGDVISVSSDWLTSRGYGRSQQLVMIFDSIIYSAAVIAQLNGSPLTNEAVMQAIPHVVDIFRRLVTGKSVEVPTVIGFSGVQLESGMRIKFGDDTLREALPIEKSLLLHVGERVTSVLETKTSIKLLDIARPNTESDGDAHFNLSTADAESIREQRRELQRRIDRIRLRALLASEGSKYLATREVARYVADPTQPGGDSEWQMDEKIPASYPITKEQAAEAERLHKVVSEKHPDSLDIAMKRILSAVSQRGDAQDAFIDALIVWENAFGVSTETNFRVTGAIAKLLEAANPAARMELQKELKKIYQARSDLVHGAKDPKPEEARKLRERAISIAIDVLRELYTNRPELLRIPSNERGANLLLKG